MEPISSMPATGQGVLVSFCNQPRGALGLALLSVTADQMVLVRTGLVHAKATGIRQVTGLTSWLGSVFVATALHETTSIIRLAPDLTATERYELEGVQAPHSLVATGPDEFHIVSSGTDEVIRIRIDPAAATVVAEETAWEPGEPGAREDLHHLNGITTVDGRLVVSGFGPRWREIRELHREGRGVPYDGFVIDITTGERLVTGLQMPHTPLPVGEGIAFCESASEAVEVPGVGVIDQLRGYTRGLCVVGDQILVGLSRIRANHPGGPTDLCAVVSLDRHDLTVRGVLDLNAVGHGIYDLLPVDLSLFAPTMVSTGSTGVEQARRRLVQTASSSE